MTMAYDISLESSQRGLQLFFRPHFNQRSALKIMASQSRKNPNLSNFGTPLGQKAIWMWAPWRGVEYIIKEKVVASPKSEPW